MIFVGDVHRHWGVFDLLLQRFQDKTVIQVGDLGLDYPINNPPAATLMMPANTYFIRGNHDNQTVAKQYANYLGDYGCKVIDGHKVFWVSGAWSIDQAKRTEGVNWWRDEELSMDTLADATELYAQEKPDVVVTHDCPTTVSEELLNRYHIPGTYVKPKIKTRTDQALQSMFEIHQPKHWIFGHFHTDWIANVNGTTFNCLNELSFLEV